MEGIRSLFRGGAGEVGLKVAYIGMVGDECCSDIRCLGMRAEAERMALLERILPGHSASTGGD